MDRLKETFRKVISALRPVDFFGYYQCSLVSWDKGAQTGDVKPDDIRLPRDGMTGLSFRSGVPGVTVAFTSPSDVKCMIGFEGGDPSKPYIHGWLNCTPDEVMVSVSSKVRLGSDSASDAIALAPAVEQRFERLEDKIDSLIQSYNLHQHGGVYPGPSMALPTTSQQVVLGPGSDVGATKVTGV